MSRPQIGIGPALVKFRSAMLDQVWQIWHGSPAGTLFREAARMSPHRCIGPISVHDTIGERAGDALSPMTTLAITEAKFGVS